MNKSLLIINGPNLNLLGTRQPEVYGNDTLSNLEQLCIDTAKTGGAIAECFQSNHEGDIVDIIHKARGRHQAIIINPGAYSHTSIAIRDALSGIDIPVWEVHISNIHAREEFRHHSYITDIARGMICGCGVLGYKLAIIAALDRLNR